MDHSVGPWPPYASYNRLTAVQGTEPHLTTAGAPPTTTAQILPGSFLSPTSVGYETVFSPMFHHAGTKPAAHYVTQHRIKQDGEYQQFFEQGAAWQQNGPFGILPHESVPTTHAKTSTYENFNHFAQSLNHLNAVSKAQVTRAQSPVITKPSVTFFQTTFSETPTTKVYTSANSNNVQSCIVSTPSARVPQTVRPYLKSQLQTKPKVYPEIPKEEPQSSPISFSIMDAPGRINYNKRPPQFQNNYRHYTNEQDFQRPKSGSDYNTNGPDCNVVVPRRPSPLQAHSQASPIGHAPSPAYPMYNSPMNSISSPQSTNHVTPPSPLDVSVPRPASSNAAYSSVITRTSEKPFTERYERQTNNQNCWDDRRKFNPNPTHNGTQANSSYNAVHPEQRSQQGYFDTTNPQVSLQDLSSCRGDPMSLVKNLQQQQSCQVPPVEIKQEIKAPVKRRKSTEKPEVGPIPPPAHTAPNPQQNGAYFDFDRWNLPTPTSKLFPGQPMHQQHQNLMVPHPHGHHPPPPLPYFTPFHLGPHPSDFTPSVELPINSYPEQNAQPSTQYQQSEEQPKVVVPNIEEELNFLSQTSRVKAPPKDKTVESSGFMTSYLRFLQGERDVSPPAVSRGNRKQNWTRQNHKTEEKPSESNGNVSVVPPPAPVPVVKRLSQGDPQDDPRYFPLPKERKRNSFDSDSDGFKSDDDFFNNRKSNDRSKSRKKTKKPERKRPKKVKTEEVIPRREVSRRAAKEKTTFQHLVKADDDVEEPLEFQDSDSDPAWTPQAKEDNEEVVVMKKPRRSTGKKKKNLMATTGIGDGYGKAKTKPQGVPLTLEDNIAASLPNNAAVKEEENPFKPGEFVVIKSEIVQEWPAIWRVDGKTLLQKYEPFEQNGITLYKNVSTYTSWTPESQQQYMAIPVTTKYQTPTETIIEFLRHEMTLIDQEYQQKCIKDCESFQDNFEVYIQTLISQALDNNFLTEIFQEKDDYFLSNVKIIDDITDSKKKKLLVLLRWPPAVQGAVCTWPCFNVIREVNPIEIRTRNCDACGKFEVAVRMLMYGQPYNSTTLEGCQPDPKAMNEKNFLMCRICATRVELANKVTHQKYLMYIECAKRVSDKRTNDPSKDTTCILNELLADEDWLNQLFYEVRTAWAEIDCIEYSLQMKSSVYTQ